jgi:hypothetical protein
MTFFDEVGKALDKLGKEKLGPALGEAGKALDTFGKEKVGPALAITAVALDQLGKEKLSPAAKKAGKKVDGGGGGHPVETSLIIRSALLLFVPSLVSGPVLWMFGWGRKVVRAGSFPSSICLLQLSVSFLKGLADDFGNRIGCCCDSSFCG